MLSDVRGAIDNARQGGNFNDYMLSTESLTNLGVGMLLGSGAGKFKQSPWGQAIEQNKFVGSTLFNSVLYSGVGTLGGGADRLIALSGADSFKNYSDNSHLIRDTLFDAGTSFGLGFFATSAPRWAYSASLARAKLMRLSGSVLH